MNKPTCIHVPPLHEESTGRISWESVDDADHYELDCHYNADFETASHGLTWADIDESGGSWAGAQGVPLFWEEFAQLPARGLSWRNIAFEDLSWQQLEQKDLTWRELRAAPVRFTIYRGPGEACRAPDQGYTWANIESGNLSWADIRDKALCWEQMDLAPSIGLSWAQLESEEQDWQRIENACPSWRAFERRAAIGLSWDSLDGQYLTWGEIQQKEQTWRDFQSQPADAKTHQAHTAEAPLYTKRIIFRVRAHGGGEASGYLTTSLLRTLPRSLAKYEPPCLHIPELHEGETADITWGGLYGAQAYALERKPGGGEFVTLYDGPGQPTADPGNKQSCPALSAVPDVDTHFLFTDHIPLYEKAAEYRVRAYNTTDSSRYAASGPLTIIPAFIREGTLRVQVTAGGKYGLLIAAREVRSFRDIPVTLRYAPALPTQDSLDGDSYRAPDVRIHKDAAGELVFSCAKRMEDEQAWSGPLLLAFTAKASGTAVFEIT